MPNPRHPALSNPLCSYAAEIFSENRKGHSLDRLDYATVGKLAVTPCSLIMAMIYLDRLNDIDPEYARRITPSELFLVSMMVSTKVYCGYDEDIYISAWAEYGNMTIAEMKKLELDFLNALNWTAYISNEEFFEKLNSVELVLAKRQGLKRGWLTYTELTKLIPSIEIAKQIIKLNAILAVSYAAGFITIAGAFLLVSKIPGSSLYKQTTTTSTDITTSTNSTLIQEANTIIGHTIDGKENNERICELPESLNEIPEILQKNQTLDSFNAILFHLKQFKFNDTFNPLEQCNQLDTWTEQLEKNQNRNILSLFSFKFI